MTLNLTTAGSPPGRTLHPQNLAIAAKLREYADLLTQQQANPFRAQAYEKAAEVVAALPEPVGAILRRDGREALVALPAVGEAIATAIAQLATVGRWSQLERLRGGLEPEALFRTLPGVGARLARQIAEDLHIGTLEALEVAVHDGRLDAEPAWGPRRLAMLRAALAERLGRPRPRFGGEPVPIPPVELLLDVDREYRREAEAGRLKVIAPRRFNPDQRAWLPVLHTERGPWRFTALYSNTARAHQLGRDRDWVVIFHQADDTPEGQHTVVTETRGPLAGRRVVRGRETECAALDRADPTSDPATVRP